MHIKTFSFRNDSTMSNIENEITVHELRRRLANGEPLALIDVREAFEFQVCRIEGCTLIPLRQIPNRVHELDAAREYVVYCHTGVRSALAAAYMRKLGFRAKNLAGGIDQWQPKSTKQCPDTNQPS
jgi:rhodanese-related sulfurtransferase